MGYEGDDGVEGWTRIVTIAVAAAIAVMVVLGVVITANAHDSTILNCFDTKKAVKIGEWATPTGLLAEAYDRNGDGRQDIVVYSSVLGPVVKGDTVDIQHRPYPVFIMTDEDDDGGPDKVYIDPVGRGQCEELRLYQDLNVPTGNVGAEKPPMNRGGRL